MRFRVVPLEERILLDAAAVMDIASVMDAGAPADFTQQAAIQALADQSKDSSSQKTPTRVLVLSSDVQNAEALKDAVLGNIKVVHYDSKTATLQTLIDQIGDALNGEVADSIAFVNYGVDGSFNLTHEVSVSLSNLMGSEALQNFWTDVGAHVKDGGSIDILACSVAGITEGVDWELEIGNVNADEIYFDGGMLHLWKETLKDANDIQENPVTIDKSSGTFTLTPNNQGQNGFTYQTEANTLISVTVSIEPAKANAERVSDPVLIKEGKFEGATAMITRAPERGTVTIHDDGSLSYTPLPGQNGIDFVGYQIKDNERACQARFIIQVIAPDNLPKTQEPAKGALTFDPASVAKIIVKHEGLGQARQEAATESPYETATTVAAFAIAAHEHDFPVGNINLSTEDSEDEKHRSFIKDAIQTLFGKSKPSNDPGDMSL